MIYAYQKTIEEFRDVSGKWLARVLIADTEAIFLKFDHKPTTSEVQAETAKYIENLAKQKTTELETITNQIEELKARKTILEQEISKPLG